MKKLIKFLAVILIVIIIALALIPFLFKDQILAKVKDYANENINATLNFSDVDLTVLSSFPNAAFSLQDISLVGKNEFEGKTLFAAKDFTIETNIVNLIKDRSKIVVNEFHLINPEINVLVTKNGNANYDIVEPSENTNSESSDLIMALDAYSIRNANISYHDRVSKLFLDIKDFTQSGSGNFTSEIFDLNTKNEIGSTSLKMDGIPYIHNMAIAGPLDVNVDLPNSKYTIKNNSLAFNNLTLDTKGFVQMKKEDIVIDLNMVSKEGDLKNFLALIPGIYSAELPNIKTSGTTDIGAVINGVYNEKKNSFPAIDISIDAKNGSLSGPDIPEPLNNINFTLNAKADNSSWSDLRVNIPQFDFEMAGNKSSGNIDITNLMQDPKVKGQGIINANLASLSGIINDPTTNIKSGTLKGDFKIEASQSDLEKEKYENVIFDGNMQLTNFNADYDAYKDINIKNMNASFNPKKLSISETEGKIAQSDFKTDLKVENPLAYFMTDKSMKGDLTFSSNYLDLTPYILEETETNVDTTESASFDESLVRESDFKYNIDIKEINYPEYKITDVKSEGKLSAEDIVMNNSSITLNENTIIFDAKVNNGYDYAMNGEKLNADINIKGGTIDLNDFMSDGEATDEQAGLLYLPTNINSTVTGSFDKIIYDKYDLSNTRGTIKLDNGKAEFKNFFAKIFDGEINFDGNYNSNVEGNPTFDMKYNLANFKWGKTYEAINTFQVLAPIGKFIDGLFNMDLSFGGTMKDDMLPDLNTISADGFIHTLEGTIKGLTPLEKIGNQLGIDKLKSSSITDTKNWFEIKEGKVFIKPFDFEIDQMSFNVGGSHSISQELNYVMKASIPREMLKKGQVTGLAEQGLSFLEQQAQNNGVNIGLGDYINLDIKIQGSITNPKINITPTGSGGKNLKSVVTDQIDNVKETVKDTIKKTADKAIDEAKDKVIEKTDEVVDMAKAKAQEETDKAVNKGKEIAKEKINEVLDSTISGAISDTLASKVTDKVDDILGEKAGKEVDKLKDKLKDFNPFGKKKKGGGK